LGPERIRRRFRRFTACADHPGVPFEVVDDDVEKVGSGGILVVDRVEGVA